MATLAGKMNISMQCGIDAEEFQMIVGPYMPLDSLAIDGVLLIATKGRFKILYDGGGRWIITKRGFWDRLFRRSAR